MAKKDYSGRNVLVAGLDEYELEEFYYQFTLLVSSFSANWSGGWLEYTEDEDKDVQETPSGLQER